MGSCTVRDPLLAANALVASSRASPRNRLFEVFIRNFPSLSRINVGNRFWAAWGLYIYRKDSLAFSRNWPTMLPSGLQTKGRRRKTLSLAPGIVLIWPPNRVETVP